MEKRRVGHTELMIDTLGLGCAPLGGNFAELDYTQAAELIDFVAESMAEVTENSENLGDSKLHRSVVFSKSNESRLTELAAFNFKTC